MATGGLTQLVLAIIITGFSGIVAQTILLREMLIIFSGNEFSIGVIMGSWVIWEATGAFLGGKVSDRLKDHGGFLIWLMLLFSLTFPLSVYLARVAKIMMGISPDLGVGIVEILAASMMILLPAGFFHGMLFTISCALFNRMTDEAPSSVGRAYFFEMVGTIAGGLIVSYVFIPVLNAFETAISVALLNVLICLAMLLSSGFHKKSFAILVSVAVLVVSVTLLAGNGANTLQQKSLAQQWQGKKIVSYENSLYQNIVVIQNQDQLTFYTDGIPAVTMPVPDIAFVEEFAHIPLLLHPNPERILLLGGGAGGVIQEILKHSTVKTVDYLEIDPQFLRTIEKFTPANVGQILRNPRVVPHYADGRIFIRGAAHRYDTVLIGFAPPLTLNANRFFTEEFFRQIRTIIGREGMLVLFGAGSTSYYSRELIRANAVSYATLKSVFRHVMVVPGDFNLFIASETDYSRELSPTVLIQRLMARGITTHLITKSHLEYRFDEERRTWYLSLVDIPGVPANKDFKPKGLYHNILFNNLLFSPYLKPLFDSLARIDLYVVAIFFGAVFLVFAGLQRKYQAVSVPYAVTTSGFASMVLHLVLLFGFQTVYGFVFHEIGILIAAFMAGLAVGGIMTASWPRNRKRELSIFIKTELAIILLSVFLIWFFRALESGFEVKPAFLRISFPILLLVSGLVTGMEFPLANRLYLKQRDHFSFGDAPFGKTVGLLYCLDLLGGWVGGVFGAFLFIPSLGLTQACLGLAILKASSCLLLLSFPRK